MRKLELDGKLDAWHRKEAKKRGDKVNVLIVWIEDHDPNHEAVLQRAAKEVGLSVEELKEWKKLQEIQLLEEQATNKVVGS